MQQASEPSRGTILIISQVYVPDPASVGQHMHDAAAGLARRGFRVVVMASARGYDDPTQHYPARETLEGVEIRRLPFSSLGKKTMLARLVGQCSYLAQVALRGLFVRGLSAVVVSTSPPMAGSAALVIHFLRRVPIKFWVMDLNPDQIIAMGKLSEKSIPARAFNMLNRWILRASSDIIALDHFMADRLVKKVDVRDKITILPPWPHSDHLETIEHSENPFRKKHGLDGKFVVMYSGNHGQTTPVTTVLDAAVRMQDRKDLVFMFIGGGLGKRDVEATIERHHPTNIIDLPYQPLDQVRYSLSAADVHVVTMAEKLVGAIHPCKVYGAMALGRPILLVGPNPCHISDIMQGASVGWHVRHGDVDGAIAAIDEMLAMNSGELKQMGGRAARIVHDQFQQDEMIEQFCNVIARGLPAAKGGSA